MRRHRLILIDGYNYLKQAMPKQDVSGLDFAGLRARLIDHLTSVISTTEAEIIVVFDGKSVSGPAHHSLKSEGDFRLIFSGKNETADSVIERLAFQNADSRQVMVVTSDYAQQKTVFREGVSRRSVREFAADVKAARAMNEDTFRKKGFNFFEDHLSEEDFDKLERIRLGKSPNAPSQDTPQDPSADDPDKDP